ncbi:MAG: hypothetical protein FWE30_08925, partial [Bacteroidales bacterium]|nr:hypothetical protein [Bacteroidales bacterium]
PINFLYHIQKMAIDQYIDVVRTLMAGGNTSVWSSAQLQISDVLGGITFNPGALFQLVVGQGNATLFKRIVDTLMDIAYAVDLVSLINATMPGFYTTTADFLGATIYGEGPIMQKYNVAREWEYHAWFLIYILFENNPVSIGNNIFRINSYQDAVTKLWEDFLGASVLDYPGRYAAPTTAASIPAQSQTVANKLNGTAITAANRVASLNDLKFITTSSLTSFPISTVLAAENTLRLKWLRWGRAWEDLKRADEGLYFPYHRTWPIFNNGTADATPTPVANTHWNGLWNTSAWAGASVAGSATAWAVTLINSDAPWVGFLPTAATGASRPFVVTLKTDVANHADNLANFYFMPELAMDMNYPSLEDGRHIYWANLAEIQTGVNNFQIRYYPAINAKRGSLTRVDWNTWLNEGYPVYNNDPTLWVNNFSNATNWENNIGISATWPAFVPKAFITTRNYEQYLFWSSAETQQAYKDLAEQIAQKIDALQEKVDELYQAWIDAQAAVKLKEYEIWALRTEANLARTTVLALEGVYNGLANDVTGIYTNFYNSYFHAYTNTLKDFDQAKANLDTFNTLGVHLSLGGWVNNRLININAQIKSCEEEIKYIEYQLDALEVAKNNMLNVVIPK